MHSNTPYCYCKISGFKTIPVEQYTRTVLLVFMMRLEVYVCNAICARVYTMRNVDSLTHTLLYLSDCEVN